MDAAKNHDIILCELEYRFFTQILKLPNSVSSRVEAASLPGDQEHGIGWFESVHGVSNLSLCYSIIMPLHG